MRAHRTCGIAQHVRRVIPKRGVDPKIDQLNLLVIFPMSVKNKILFSESFWGVPRHPTPTTARP